MGFFSKVKNIFSSSAKKQGLETSKNDQTEKTQAGIPVPNSVIHAEALLPNTQETSSATQSNIYPATTTPAQYPSTPTVTETGQKITEEAQTLTPAVQEASALFATQEYLDLGLLLRKAEPKLSVWLSIILKGIHKADETLWQRVRFLLTSLEAPTNEIDTFIYTTKQWLESMGYEELEDFRSELQYRLALALDLEDEEDERNRLFIKLSEGLSKTREQLSKSLNLIFATGRKIDASLWEELEETLIMADVGFDTAMTLTEQLRRRAERENISDASELRSCMADEMLKAFKPIKRISAVTPPEVILVVGVNGVGKTTTIAKLCHRAVLQGKKTMLVAGDTFRAAAVEQLEIWAQRTNAGFYAKGHGADPAAVAYEALEKAMQEDYDTVFIDTAGRLHTKNNLMEELTKISKVVDRIHKGAPHRTILVIDATTGQNALSQIKLFNEATKLDDLVFTKLDGTAKGGIAVAAAMQYNIPISFIGLGEKMEDLRPFDAKDFVTALLA